MAFKENRKIKVQPKYAERRNTNSIYAYAKRYITVPFIRLEGKWLQECGFEPDSHINIHCENGKLIITPASDDE